MPSPCVPFNTTVGTAAVAANTLTGATSSQYGLRVSVPSGNSGDIYWGVASGLTIAANSCLLQKGTETTINQADYGGDLTKLYFIASAAAQAITGAVL